MVMVTYSVQYSLLYSFFTHYMDKFMHLRWLLIIIWISHDILTIVSYFLFIIISLTCRLHARECWQTLQNIDFLSWPWIWRTSRSIFRYISIKIFKKFRLIGISTKLKSTGIHYPWDPILGWWRKLAPSPCLDVPGWLLCSLPCSSYQGCLHVGHSVFTTFISTAGYRNVFRKWRKNLLVN